MQTLLRPNRPTPQLPLALATALLLSMYLRASVIESFLTQTANDYLYTLQFILIVIVTIYLVSDRTISIQFRSIAIFITTGLSLLLNNSGIANLDQSVPQSALKWLAWILMLTAVGSVVHSHRATFFREQLHKTNEFLLNFIIAASAIWWAIGLPTFGKGEFTGVLSHAMILSPFAAIVGITSFNRYLDNRSKHQFFLFLSAVLLCTLSGSRISMLGLACGIAFSVFQRNANPATVVAGMNIIILASLLETSNVLSLLKFLPEQIVGTLEQKGTTNTRTELWELRLEEFFEDKLTGVGFGMGQSASWATTENLGALEPGSGYLIVLSMTGILGATSVFALFVSLAFSVTNKLASNHKQKRHNHLAAVGCFWAVHFVAEGYVLSPGSPLCFLFWCWIGEVSDWCTVRKPKKTTSNVLSLRHAEKSLRKTIDTRHLPEVNT